MPVIIICVTPKKKMRYYRLYRTLVFHGYPLPPSLDDHVYDSFLEQLFELNELQVIIKKLRIKSSPGLDTIDYTVGLVTIKGSEYFS